MIMLDFDLKLNTNIVAYKILHSLTRNGNFSMYKQGFMNFKLMAAVLSDSESLPGMSFRRPYYTC
jgi:hypothetical protein